MRRILITAVVCLAAALSVNAQSARVSGHVADSRQGMIQGCEVAIRNTGTEARFRTLTTDSGSFLLPPVPPGTYEITASAPGFAIERLTGLTLDVGESKVIELVLQPASVHEEVQVMDTPPEVTTDRPDRSVVIDRTFVASIPLNVRNPLQLINFSPAVTKGDDGLSGQNVTSESRTNTWRINGAKGSTTDIALDGGTDTTAYYNQAAGIPGVDAVQEYRVYTSAYAPEFGRTSGGTVAYALRSGSNAVHGSLFEYLRNSDLDADGFNADKAGQPIAAFRRNQFGGTVGGPVVLPRLYHGRDKTFFFVSYEGLRDSAAGSFTGTVPTALERAGNFSQTKDANGNPIVMYDPSTTRLDPSAPSGTTRYIRTAFPGNLVPASGINPIAAKLLSYYPMPNEAGVGQSSTNNYFSNAPGTNNNDRIDARLDQRISDHQLVYAHLDWFSNHIIQNNYYGNGMAAVNSNDFIPGFNIMLHHTWSISPALVFDHHFSWAHSESNRTAPVEVTASQLGFPASVAPGLTDQMVPQLSMTRASGLGNNYPFEDNESSVWQYAGDLSWLKSIHTFKFGYDFRLYPVQLYDPQQLAINATSNFTGGPNPNAAVADSGSGIADLLLGAAGVTSGYVPETRSRHGYLGFYAQDAARLTRRLTVTYGLRVNYETGDVENQNQLNYIDLKSASPLAGQVPGFPSLVGGVGIPGLNGASRQLQLPRGLHLDPRVGVAFQVNSKTVIHSGFGIFHHPLAAWEQYPNALGTTRTINSIAAQSDGVTPLFNLSNPFPSGLPAPYGNAAGSEWTARALRECRGAGYRARPEHHRTAAHAGHSVSSQLVFRYPARVAAATGGDGGLCGQCRGAPHVADPIQPDSGFRAGAGIEVAQRGRESVLRCHHRPHFHAEPRHRAVCATAPPVSGVSQRQGDQCGRGPLLVPGRSVDRGKAPLARAGGAVRLYLQQSHRQCRRNDQRRGNTQWIPGRLLFRVRPIGFGPEPDQHRAAGRPL
ncbi:TonB-dependent receptor plug (fragment) [Candidatus Sulfopaludibacter sp. SbA4]